MPKPKNEVPFLVLLESLHRQRRLLEDLDWLTPKVLHKVDREALWAIREQLIQILLRDLHLKKGVSPSLLVREP